jgi:hypothetical protein
MVLQWGWWRCLVGDLIMQWWWGVGVGLIVNTIKRSLLSLLLLVKDIDSIL